MPVVNFLRRRVCERSSWVHMAGAVAASCMLPAPWCFYVFGLNLIGLLIPDQANG